MTTWQQVTSEDLSTAEKEIFTDFTTNGEIKKQFSNKSLFEFWAVADELSVLKIRAFRILVDTTYRY
jgi:hypothetical protein